MNVYDYIKAFAAAIVADADVLAYCTTNFSSGLLVAIDDDSEKMLGSNDAPYCLLISSPGSDDSPVAEESAINIRIEVGTTVVGDAPYIVTDTPRTKTANGLQSFAQGEKAVDLLDLILATVKATGINDCTILTNSTIEASGALLFPLALAVSNIIISETKSLQMFN